MKFVSGLILIDAPHSALNMLGTDTSIADRNKMVVKKLKKGRTNYAYVSAQAWRYWWRQTLEEKFNWNTSPLEKVESKNQVYTNANPIKHEDDDVFGYMRAVEDLTVTRVSPLKNTPLISVLSDRNSVTSDFANSSRHEGDPVIYESEFYSTVFKGAFSLDLECVGNFSFKNKTGFRNLINFDKVIKEAGNSKAKNKKTRIKKLEKLRDITLWEEDYLKLAEEVCVSINDDFWLLRDEIRARRARETIEALKYLTGGAKQTLFLTDITPKFVILAIFDGGLNPFITDIIQEDTGKIIFDETALIDRIRDYSDVVEPKKIYLGKDKGFMKEWDSKMINIKKEMENGDNNGNESIQVILGSVTEVIEQFSDEINEYYKVGT